MLSEALQLECLAIAPTIAPELSAQPLYLIDAGEFRDLPCNDGCSLGWTSIDRIFDPLVRERLGDRYRGPGRVVVLDSEAIAKLARPGSFESCVRNVFLHELGHDTPYREVLETDVTRYTKAKSHLQMVATAGIPSPEPVEANDPHGIEFVRRTTHLLHRAIVAGFEVTPHRIYGPWEWMSQPEYYLTALLPECVRMAGESFATIEAETPPTAFTELWAGNLEFYHKHFSPKGNP